MQLKQQKSNGRKEGESHGKGGSNKLSSHKKSVERDREVTVGEFQEEYYTAKERREKRMKVTLKDLKKQRRSIHESDHEYGKGFEKKDSLSHEETGVFNSHQS